MRYLYLFTDLGTVLIPFLFSFHPRIKFYRTWNALLPALLITAVYFIIWDIVFTRAGVWGFNDRYIMGSRFFGLPLEELLFFICIPYACVFTYHCLKNFFNHPALARLEKIFSPVLILFLAIMAVIFRDRAYTAAAFSGLAVLILLCSYVFKIKWLMKFYLIYIVLLVPFLIVNGILTGTGPDEPVVWYNAREIIGIRILTIPFEDIFYGLQLVLLNTLLWQYFLKKYSVRLA